MIEIQNLQKSYKDSKGKISHILQGVSLSVAKGEIYGVIGKSGAGKSTLLKCVNLLETPDSGNIIIDGVNLSGLNQSELCQARHKIGMIFQGFNLIESKTVFANAALPLIWQKQHTKAEIQKIVADLLDLVGLSDFANKYPSSLSGGQKQRVGIARALSTTPKVLLSDEATSALDPETTNSILELLLDINKRLGITILLITHEIDVIRKICDKVAILDRGNIVESGETVKIILHPKHALTRRLIIEEEAKKYLEQVADFYKFSKTNEKHLLVLSFIGAKTFEPILEMVAAASGVKFSILRGELGRIKSMPFGQLLIEAGGKEEQLKHALKTLEEMNVHYEIID